MQLLYTVSVILPTVTQHRYSIPLLYAATLSRCSILLPKNAPSYCYSIPLVYTVTPYHYSIPLLCTVTLRRYSIPLFYTVTLNTTLHRKSTVTLYCSSILLLLP